MPIILLGCGGRRIRNSRLALAIKGVQGQPGLYDTVSKNIKEKKYKSTLGTLLKGTTFLQTGCEHLVQATRSSSVIKLDLICPLHGAW